MTNNNYMYYKGYPLVRNGNTLYYGYAGEPYIAMIQTLHTNTENGTEVADLLRIVLMETETAKPKDNVKRESLYDALDLAYTWLERTNKQ